LAERLSLNRYLYAAANPATLIDPTGLRECEWDSCEAGTADRPDAGKPGRLRSKDFSGRPVQALGLLFGACERAGHTFNAVNQGGVIRFLDGQTGGAGSFGDD